MRESEEVTLRQYFEKMLAERDRFYRSRLLGIEKQHASDIAGLEKSMLASFAAYKEAVLKAETAQQELNIKNNEFRGQLKDQSETLMPRAEAQNMFKSSSDKLISVETQFDSKLDGAVKQFEAKFETARQDLAGLRESRSEGGGKSQGMQTSWIILIGAVGLIASILSIATVAVAVLLRR